MVTRLPFLLAIVVALGGSMLCCLAAPSDAGTEWTVQTFPSPFTSPERCGRHNVRRVCDPDNVLSDIGANLVEEVLQDILDGKDPFPVPRCGSKGWQGFRVRPHTEVMKEWTI